MYTARVQNGGEMLTLTGKETEYQIISIQGLNPPPAQINMTTLVGLDGARYNSAKLETRNIVITVRINGDVEKNRNQLYRFFKTKDRCTFYFSNETHDVSIEGYVDSLECDLFTNSETAQISVICPFPYFRSVSEIIADSETVFEVFTFPFSINIGEPVIISSISEDADGGIDVYNGSETETGVILEIDFNEDADSIEIKNVTTGDDMKLIYEFREGDRVIVNTNKGEKSIVLVRGGEITNIFPAIQRGSAFFQLIVGNNRFEYLLDGEPDTGKAVGLVFRWYNLYRGV